MTRATLEKKNGINLMTALCMVAFFLSNISYLPRFTMSGMTQLLSYPGWAMIFAAILLYRQFYVSNRDVKFIVILLVAFSTMTLLQGLNVRFYFSSLLTKCFMLAMIILLAGGLVARTGQTWGRERHFFNMYILASLILCVSVYFEFLIGQDLSSPIYEYGSKNETAFLATSSVIMLLHVPERRKSKLLFLLRVAVMAFFVYVVACMRCRSMLLATIIVFILYLFQKSGIRAMKIVILLSFAGLLLALRDPQFYDDLVNNIIFAARDSENMNDLSSGRMDQIARGWALFKQNMFLGTGDTRTVDCFYVSALMQYGLIFGGLLLVLSIYPVIWGLWNYQRIKSPTAKIMLMCAFAYALGGVFEENAPYGPGVRCYVSWFLFGYLRVQQLHGYFGGNKNEEDRIT